MTRDCLRLSVFFCVSGLQSVVYSVMITFWTWYFYLELGSWYMDYELQWMGSIGRMSIAMGRQGNIALFLLK